MHVPTLIARKRDGEALGSSEIEALVNGYTSGEVPDYQMSAFAMAVYFQGMNAVETAALTRAMMESGDVMQHREGHPLIIDKHSTGGIGDKVSLVLAPLVACTGAWVPMVSGRGLGITGGTLDKLEAIPGFRVGLSLEEAYAQLDRIGVVMMGQTERFCPADKKLYALRDVSGTVPSIPLITASIMSKKLAESLDRLVLDVKYGKGAFMRNKVEAKTLADGMIAVGREMGVEVHARLNPMDQPTGRTVGNALEVIESIEALEGRGPTDLIDTIIDLSIPITGWTDEALRDLLASGRPRELFDSFVREQGGNPSDLSKLSEIHRSLIIREVPSAQTGTVKSVDAGMVGQASLQLGAGRARANDPVNHAVGFDQLVKIGDPIHQGASLCRIHANSQADFDMAEAMIYAAVKIES
ncbi:MAG: thymidine phosphorylase [Verrucomicrobiales bacterium VVV1]|nr:MAG: thymidine phosphorylase [Verrucomicrobiales bacterium VVV1]